VLNGGTGNDVLYGGADADTFYFGLGSGQDTISDFSAAQNDHISLHAYAGGVVNGGGITFTQQGANILIDLGGGNTVTVLNTVNNAAFQDHIVW